MGRTSLVEPHLDQVLQWNSQGLTRQEIAERLGLKTHVVQSFLQRRNIQPQFLPGRLLVEKGDEVRRLIEEEGETHEQVARRLGVHRSTVERYCSSLGLRTARTGPRSGAGHSQRWGGGRCLTKGWYVSVYAPLHPQARSTGYVPEHRLVLEVVLGRYLDPAEVVDHVDGHPQHNWPENLRLFASNADHLKATLSGKPKASLVRSALGDWPSRQRTLPSPGPDDTLSQCPSDIRAALERHIEIHRPTLEHVHLARKTYLRTGPWSPAFQPTSTGLSTD